MERATLVAESALSSRELAEVARGHRADIIVELEDDSPGGFGVNGDVKLRVRVSAEEDESGCGVKTHVYVAEGGKGGGCQRRKQAGWRGTYPLDIVGRRDGEGGKA